MSSMCLFLMWTSAPHPRPHLLHGLVSLSVQSTSFHTLGLWQVQVLIIYCRMAFDLSRWPWARGHKWGPQVMDAITARPGTNSHRHYLTVHLFECMKQIKEHGVFSRMRGIYAAFQTRAKQLQSRGSLPFSLSLCTERKHNSTNKSLS